MKKFFAVFLAVVMIFSIVGALADSYIVTTKSGPLNVRCGPGKNYEVFDRLPKGSIIEVTSIKDGWAEIPGESIGYVMTSFLSKYDGVSMHESTTTTYYVSASSVNVRKKASAKSTRIDTLKKGQKVEVLSISNGWAKVMHNGSYAYIKAEYLKKDKVCTSKPVNTAQQGIRYAKVNVEKCGTLNVRAEMSKKAKLLERLPDGTCVRIISYYGEWCKIYYNGNKVGYVMSMFLK